MTALSGINDSIGIVFGFLENQDGTNISPGSFTTLRTYGTGIFSSVAFNGTSNNITSFVNVAFPGTYVIKFSYRKFLKN